MNDNSNKHDLILGDYVVAVKNYENDYDKYGAKVIRGGRYQVVEITTFNEHTHGGKFLLSFCIIDNNGNKNRFYSNTLNSNSSDYLFETIAENRKLKIKSLLDE